MRTFTVSSNTWNANSDNVLRLVQEVALNNNNRLLSINISRQNIERFQSEFSQVPIHKYVMANELVTDKVNESGVINIEAIRRVSHSLIYSDFVVFNFTGFSTDVISKVLSNIRIGLSFEKNWPQNFIVVCDDNIQYLASEIVSHAFVLRPNIMIDFAVKRIVRGLERKSRVLRLFGSSLNSFGKFFDSYLAWTYKRSDKKLIKETGKHWEE